MIFSSNHISQTEKGKIKNLLLELNDAIVTGDAQKVLSFFDIPYHVRFEALSFLFHFDSHGFMPHNQTIFLNTSNHLLYPALHRDYVPRILYSSEDLEVGYDAKYESLNLLNNIFARSDQIRYLKYEVAYKLINNKILLENNRKSNYNKINNFLTLYFPDFLNVMLGDILNNEKRLIVFEGVLASYTHLESNLQKIQIYLDRFNPRITYIHKNSNTIISIEPNSQAPLQIELEDFFSKMRILDSIEISEQKIISNSWEGISKHKFLDTYNIEINKQKRTYMILIEGKINLKDLTFKIKNNLSKEVKQVIPIYEPDLSTITKKRTPWR